MVQRIKVLTLPGRRRRRGWKGSALVAALATAVLPGTSVDLRSALQFSRWGERSDAGALAADVTVAVPKIAMATQLMPVSPEEAERLNRLRGADMAEVVAARPFTVQDRFRSDPRFLSALQCLTQAVYYEAGSEPEAGQRAVAQVVLNRTRHPAFPNSVCGVVYQGSELPTGCQFTFTCDGSLLRPPFSVAWDRARKVALAAMSGWVEQPVGLSTHYHATYVVPYWAAALDKVTLVGSHIFYSLPGRGGSIAAFRANYDFAGEFTPAVATLEIQPMEAIDAVSSAQAEIASVLPQFGQVLDGGSVTSSPLEADHSGEIAIEQSQLRADQQRGVLTVRGADSRLLVD